MPNDLIYHGNRPPPTSPLVCKLPGRTRQSEKDACDINKIMEKYERTGVLPPVQRDMFFADVSAVGDYRSALDRVRLADETFMNQPAMLRAKFDNDPAKFLDFCSDENNREEMVSLGLIEDVSGKPPEPEVVPAEPVPEPSSAEPSDSAAV